MTTDILPVPGGKQRLHILSRHDNDQVEIIYCPDKEKGLWFLRRGGAGPLQPKGLQLMKGIVKKE